MTTPDPDQAETAVVEVRIPADVGFVSTLRITGASLAARANLTVDDIEDLRLAVDEACALLIPHAVPGSTLDAHFELSDGRLSVDTSVVTSDAGQEPDREGFAWTVLGALVSEVSVSRDGDRLAICVTKIREAARR